MKFLNKLTEEQLTELVKIYSGEDFVSVIKIEKGYNWYDISVNEEWDDDEEKLYSVEKYTLYDYDVIVWNHELSKKENEYCLVKYRRKFLEWIGNNYAISYLLNKLED